MHTLLETAHFSRPYLARYWPRFVLGIFLGILFGASNFLSLGSVYVIANRLDAPAHIQEVTERGRQAQALREQGENVVVHGIRAQATALKQNFYVLIDPWLPLKDRPLDWKQCLGGFLFVPAAILLRGLLGYGSSYLMAWSGLRITNAVKGDAFRKVNSLSLDYFQKHTTGELINRIETDGAAINNFLKLGLSDLVKEPSTIFFMLCGLFLLDWKFTLIALAFAPLCIIPTRKVSKRIKDLARRDFAANSGMASVTMESFQNVRITKAYALEEVHAQAFSKAVERSAYFTVKGIQSKELLNPIVQTLNAMGISALLLYAFWNTHTTYANLTIFIVALMAFYTPFKKLNGIGVYLNQLSVSLERLMALFKIEPSVREAANPVALGAFTKSLDFKNVGFSYGEAEVLDKINFSLKRGQRLGLVGESGSGKSSLINLIFRFYDPTSARSPWTACRSRRRGFPTCAFISRSSARTSCSSTPPWRRTSASAKSAPRARKSSPRRRRPTRTISSPRCPRATTRRWANEASASPAASASASPSRAPSSATRPSSCWTKPPRHSIRNPRPKCKKPSTRLRKTAPSSASRTASPRSAAWTKSSSSKKAASSSKGSFDQLLTQNGVFTAMAARQSIFPQLV